MFLLGVIVKTNVDFKCFQQYSVTCFQNTNTTDIECSRYCFWWYISMSLRLKISRHPIHTKQWTLLIFGAFSGHLILCNIHSSFPPDPLSPSKPFINLNDGPAISPLPGCSFCRQKFKFVENLARLYGDKVDEKCTLDEKSSSLKFSFLFGVVCEICSAKWGK